MKIISWNVNGIRSNIIDSTTAKNKSIRNLDEHSPLGQIIQLHDPDIICFQETRLGEELYTLFSSESIQQRFPYRYWSSSKKEKARSGNRYSGTSIWSKIPAEKELYELPGLDNKEGRFIQLDFNKFTLINTYTPNSGSNWDYRLQMWEPCLRAHILTLTKNKPLIYCGDLNIANKDEVWFGDLLEQKLQEIIQSQPDSEIIKPLTRLIRSKQRFHLGNKILCGYSKEEQKMHTKLLHDTHLIDCYKHIYPTCCDKFTWFDIRTKGALQANKGWRIDKFLVRETDSSRIVNTHILYEIGTHRQEKLISDHIPILLQFNI